MSAVLAARETVGEPVCERLGHRNCPSRASKIPIYFYPSNYYLHVLFIWPLLLGGWSGPDGDKEWSLIAASVLGFCSLQWFGWLIPGRYGQFLFWSGMLLGLIAVLLAIAIAANKRRAISETA